MKKLLLFTLIMLCVSAFAQKQYTLQSPDKDITVTIEAGEQLTYAVSHGNTCVLTPSPIGMKLADGTTLGTKPAVKSAKTLSVNQTLASPLYKRTELQKNRNSRSLRGTDADLQRQLQGHLPRLRCWCGLPF